MRHVRLAASILGLSLAAPLAGCSLLFDGSGHTGGGAGDGGGADAGFACTVHEDCLDQPNPDFYICAERGGSRVCVETCSSAADCVDHPEGTACDAEGDCGCASDADCPGTTCMVADGYCALPCFEDAACTVPTRPVCNDVGVCAACGSDADCMDIGAAAPFCRTDGACAQCLVDGDCVGSGMTCTAEGTCMAAADPCDVDGDGFRRMGGGCDTMGMPVDCDDDEASIYPGALPTCGDTIDVSCSAGSPLLGLFGAGAVAEVGFTRPVQVTATELGTGPFIHQISVLAAPPASAIAPSGVAGIVVTHTTGATRDARITTIMPDGTVGSTADAMSSIVGGYSSITTLRPYRLPSGRVVVGVLGLDGTMARARLLDPSGTLLKEDAAIGAPTFGLAFWETDTSEARMAFRRRPAAGAQDNLVLIGEGTFATVSQAVARRTGADTWIDGGGGVALGNFAPGVFLWGGGGSATLSMATGDWRGAVRGASGGTYAVVPGSTATGAHGVGYLPTTCGTTIASCASTAFAAFSDPQPSLPALTSLAGSADALMAFAGTAAGGEFVGLRGLTPTSQSVAVPVLSSQQTGLSNMRVRDVAVDAVDLPGGNEIAVVVAAVLQSGDAGTPAIWATTMRACRMR